jgi:Protein of unknown function (DUF2283)
MKTTYFDDEDTLVIRLSDKPIVREVSQDWRTHIGFAADGSVVETVILEARECGAWPFACRAPSRRVSGASSGKA